MKWLELHLDTQPAGIEPATELLSEYGIDSLMIDEEGDFKDFLENNRQYWDYVDDDLLEQMHGKSRITFYLEDSAEGYNTLAQFRIGLSAFKKQHPEYAPLILSMENVEDADWENNWKQFYKPMEIGERQPRHDAPLLTGIGAAYPRRGKGARSWLRQRHFIHRRAAARREGRLCLRYRRQVRRRRV